MTRTPPDIDFHQIRPYGQPASRSSAFEELASILIEQGAVQWPDGVRFARFGNPDGGREGNGVLLNGDVWAWQAKYLFEFDSSAAGQVTSSVRAVTEPRTEPEALLHRDAARHASGRHGGPHVRTYPLDREGRRVGGIGP